MCHTVQGGLNVEQWEKYLPDTDPKKEFIVNGIKRGFKLSELDKHDKSKPVLMKNYFSAFKYKHAVENQILEEIENGRYILQENAK